MRRIWLLVIIVAIVAAVALAYNWQNIPYLNTAITESGIIQKLGEAKTAIENLDPMSLVSILGGSVGSFLLIGKSLVGKIRESREQANQMRVGFQDEKGTLLAGFTDAKNALTGSVSKLQQEYDSLKTQADSTKTELEGVIDVKDDKIMEVQDSLTKVQAELNAEKSKLLETTKQMDEYRIALEQKSVPTSN